jgi:hypothetical protein
MRKVSIVLILCIISCVKHALTTLVLSQVVCETDGLNIC